MLINSLLSALIFVLIAIKLLKSRQRNLPPSPFALPIIGHLHLLKDPLHHTLFNLSQKYGQIFSLRLGYRFVVVVSSPSLVKECFTENDIVLTNRPHFAMTKYVNYNSTTLPVVPYGDLWRNLRRLATIDVFSSRRLNLSSDMRRDEVHRFLRKLYRISANGFAKVELKSMFTELAFNIVMRMITGKPYIDDDGVNSGKERRLPTIIKELFELALCSYAGDYFPLVHLVDYNGYIKNIRSLGDEEDALIQEIIDQHRGNYKGDAEIKNSMISHLLSLQESEPEYYTDVIIKGMIQVIINGGLDTTASTLEWAMSYLLNNPHALEKARVELEKNVGQGRLVEESDLSNLPYLQNIMMETLRLKPSAPLLIPREASDNCSIGGYQVPKGTILMVNAWAIQRDPKVWEDATSFRPERFEGKKMSDESYRWMPFGLGRRACPGVGLAQREIGLTLGSMIKCFEWKRVNEEEIDMIEGKGLTMPKVTPLEAMCKPTHLANKTMGSNGSVIDQGLEFE